MQLRRYSEARDLIETYRRIDVYNTGVGTFLNNINQFEEENRRRQELEERMRQGHTNVNTPLDLAASYLRLGMNGEFQALMQNLLQGTNIPPNAYLPVAQICGDGRQWDLAVVAMRRHLQSEPRDFKTWINIAFAEMLQKKQDDAMNCLRHAVATGGEAARSILRQDRRFAPMRDRTDFRALLPPPPQLDPRLLQP
jgi:hypothetical protein